MKKSDLGLAKRFATLACAAALCAAPLGLAACSSGDSSSQQAETTAETAAETAAETEEKQAEPIYVVSKYTSDMQFEDSSQTIDYVYTLDDDGNHLGLAVNAVSSTEGGNYSSNYSIEYDDEGMPVSGVFGAEEGMPATFETTLDENNRLAKVVKTYSDDATIATWEFTYGEGDAISSLVCTSESTGSEDAYSFTSTYTFNEYGFATGISSASSTGDSTSIAISYEGDDPAHPTTEIAEATYSDGSTYTLNYELAYDENGNLSSAKSDTYTMTYEYKLVDSPSASAKVFSSIREVGGSFDFAVF